MEPWRSRVAEDGFDELVVDGISEGNCQESITEYVCFDHGCDVQVVFQGITTIVANNLHFVHLLTISRKCIDVDPVDKDIEDALNVFEFDHPPTSFFPWSVERFLEVLGVVSEQRLVYVVLLFLGADLNRDELAHCGRTTT